MIVSGGLCVSGVQTRAKLDPPPLWFSLVPDSPIDAFIDDLTDLPTSAQLDEPAPNVMVFNANDPTGAGGLSADVLAMASVGARACPVLTATLIRDTNRIHDHFALDAQVISDQAHAIGHDMDIAAIRVGFVGSEAGLRAVAEIAGDFDEVPIVVSLPDLTWCEPQEIEVYLQALAESVLPLTTVLVANYNELWRWLLEDWAHERAPRPRDMAGAAAAHGCAFVLITGMPDASSQQVLNVLASPEQELLSVSHERLDARFIGVSDTLAAALAGCLATGMEPVEAATEALSYLQACLVNGLVPGMGAAIPDRMFWAQADGDSQADSRADSPTAADNDLASPIHSGLTKLARTKLWVQGPSSDTPTH